MAIFRPKEKLKIFTDLDPEEYRKRGFKAVLLDIDNTIAIPNTGGCDERAAAFIEKLEKAGFKVLIFSNNSEERVKMFIGDRNIRYYHSAMKPLPFAYRKVCRQLGFKPSEVIVMGDQLLTDILGANLAGCYGIYCRQLQEVDTFPTCINRWFEKLIWRYVLHEKM